MWYDLFIFFLVIIYINNNLYHLNVNCIKMKVAIVTGGNKGIGFEICKKLGQQGIKTILACRNDILGIQAVDTLKSYGYNAEYRNLDISDKCSISRFSRSINEDYNSIDILINNAAIAYKNSDPTPFQKQALPTITTNFFGTLWLTESLLPVLRKADSPKIVNIASQSGHLKILKSNELKSLFTSSDLELLQLQDLMNKFIIDVESNQHIANGWPNTCYGMSKLGVIAMTKVFAREEMKIPNSKLVINACCPGWCSTDMSSHKGPRTAEQGAITPVMLALSYNNNNNMKVTGKFFYDENEIEW